MFCYLCCLSPFASSNLVNLFNASAGGWGVMAEWLRAFIAGENVGKEASNSSIFPMTPFSPWSVVFTPCCSPSCTCFSHAKLWSILPHAEGNFAHQCMPRRSVRPSWWSDLPLAWRVVLSHAVHPSVVAFFHSRRD